jgi:hypothetical protein
VITWRTTAAWVAALVLVTVLTWQIVGLADSQVGDVPVAAAPTLPVASSTSNAIATSPPPDTTSLTSASTTTAATSPSPSTSTPPSTEAAAEWSVRTVNSAGGTVVVRHRPGEVELQAATPASGFSVEIDDNGPDRVRVEFEADDADIRVEVRWRNGELEISIED